MNVWSADDLATEAMHNPAPLDASYYQPFTYRSTAETSGREALSTAGSGQAGLAPPQSVNYA